MMEENNLDKVINGQNIKKLSKATMALAKMAAVLRYGLKFHRFPNLKNPHDLNEKIMWLEFKTDTTPWSVLSDKNLVREYVASKGLEHLLTKQYGHYTDVKDIDFGALPNSFVAKTNNGYGTVILVEDKSKINVEELREKLGKMLAKGFGLVTGEPHYLRIHPCIVIEELLQIDKSLSSSLVDYKIWVFNGKADSCFCCTNRHVDINKVDYNYYTLPDWERHPEIITPKYKNNSVVPKPSRLEDMMHYAEILAEGFPQVRVDFYQVGNKVYFGEMTFSCNGARVSYFTQEELSRMGKAITLPMK